MACGACSARTRKETYLHTAPDGTKTAFQTETEAKAAVARKGGSWSKQ